MKKRIFPTLLAQGFYLFILWLTVEWVPPDVVPLLSFLFVLAFWLEIAYLIGEPFPIKRILTATSIREAWNGVGGIYVWFLSFPLLGLIFLFRVPKRIKEAERIFDDRVRELLILEFLAGFEKENLDQLVERLRAVKWTALSRQ